MFLVVKKFLLHVDFESLVLLLFFFFIPVSKKNLSSDQILAPPDIDASRCSVWNTKEFDRYCESAISLSVIRSLRTLVLSKQTIFPPPSPPVLYRHVYWPINLAKRILNCGTFFFPFLPRNESNNPELDYLFTTTNHHTEMRFTECVSKN